MKGEDDYRGSDSDDSASDNEVKPALANTAKAFGVKALKTKSVVDAR